MTVVGTRQLLGSSIGGTYRGTGLDRKRLSDGVCEFRGPEGKAFDNTLFINVAIGEPWCSEKTMGVAWICRLHGSGSWACGDECEAFPMLIEMPRWQAVVSEIEKASFKVTTYRLPLITTLEEALAAGPPVPTDVEFAVMHLSNDAEEPAGGGLCCLNCDGEGSKQQEAKDKAS